MQTAWCKDHYRLEPIVMAQVDVSRALLYYGAAYVHADLACGRRTCIVMSHENLRDAQRRRVA